MTGEPDTFNVGTLIEKLLSDESIFRKLNFLGLLILLYSNVSNEAHALLGDMLINLLCYTHTRYYIYLFVKPQMPVEVSL